MTTLEKIKAEFISLYPKNYAGEPELGGKSCVFSLNEILQIIDKYAERQKCDTCYHNKTEFSVCQYCTDGDKYEEAEQEPNIDMESNKIKILQKRSYLEGFHEALKTSKWFSVIERMPELGVKVLVQRDKFGFGEFDIGFYDGYHERRYWQNGTTHTEMVPHWWYFGGRLSDKNPIAWMPLPEPYKVEPQESEDKE